MPYTGQQGFQFRFFKLQQESQVNIGIQYTLDRFY